MAKLTSKVQKNMFKHAKNRKKFWGRVPGPPSSTCAFSGRRAPLTFFIFLRPWLSCYVFECVIASLNAYIYIQVSALVFFYITSLMSTVLPFYVYQ